MNLKNLSSKPRLALLGASGMIAAAAFAGTTIMSHATAPPQSPSTKAAPAEPAEVPDTPGTEAKTETPDVNEPGVPGAGHTDEAPGATTESNVNHEVDGAE